MLEYPSTTHFQCPGSTWPCPSSLWCGAVVYLLSRKTLPKHNVSTFMFDGGDGVIRSKAELLLLQTRRVELMPKSWILVSADHNTFTQFSSESLANFRRDCTCAFLSRGTLRALQDFSSSRRSVLPIVFLVTMVPAALQSLTRSSRVVLCWFLTVLRIIETPRGEISHGAPVRGDWQLCCVSYIWE